MTKAWFVGNKDECYDEDYCGDYVRANTRNEAKQNSDYMGMIGALWTEFTATREPKLDGEGPITNQNLFEAGVYGWIECQECYEKIYCDSPARDDFPAIMSYYRTIPYDPTNNEHRKINESCYNYDPAIVPDIIELEISGPAIYDEKGNIFCSQECLDKRKGI